MRRAWLLAILLGTGGFNFLRGPDEDVEKGNQAFAGGRYEEALGHYDAALGRGDDPRVHYDKGAALYKLGEKAGDAAQKAELMQRAEEEFSRAADTTDSELKSSAYYNLGNTHYQRERWDEAAAAYKRALRADPANQQARYNLEMALRQRKKDQQQQQQQQQGQQGQQGQQPDQQQQQQQPGQQGQQDQQQGQQGQQQQQQPGQQGQQQQPDQQQGQGQQPDQQQQQGQGQQPDQQQQGQQGQQPQQDPQQQGQQGQQGQQPGQQGQQPGQPPRGQQPQQQPDADGDDEEDAPESLKDELRKLDALEKRSGDLWRRKLRQGGRQRDPLGLPSRKDW